MGFHLVPDVEAWTKNIHGFPLPNTLSIYTWPGTYFPHRLQVSTKEI
jgi:hypothetical protein